LTHTNAGIKSYYEAIWSQPYPAVPLSRRLEKILSQYVSSESRCLDVGCGDGQSGAAWLSPLGCRYVGVDISEVAVRNAQTKGLNAILIEDANHLPFEDSSFEVVLCTEVLEHLFEPQIAAGEILRVLRSGGVLIATVPNVAYWRRRVDLLFFGRWNPLGDALSIKEPWRDPHIRFFTPSSLRRMLTSVGFGGMRVTGHYGGILRDLPFVGGWFQNESSWVYQAFESLFPGLLACRLIVVASKPEGGRRGEEAR